MDPCGQTLPMIGNVAQSRLRDRSGLMRVQESPRSSERYRYWLPQYIRPFAWGLMMYGASQFGRSAVPGAPPPPPRPPPPPPPPRPPPRPPPAAASPPPPIAGTFGPSAAVCTFGRMPRV